MKMNETCANCDWNISEDEIVECTSPAEICYDNHWKPKEKKIKKQMTEEQAKEFIEILIDELEKEVERLKK